VIRTSENLHHSYIRTTWSTGWPSDP